MEPKSQYSRPFIFSISWLIGITIILITAWPGRFYFLNDDFIHIPLAGQGFIGQHNSVRYVGDLSLMLDNYLFGRNAFGYHFTNLLLHLANIWLLIQIIRELFVGQVSKLKFNILLFSPLLFALYGFHSDAVFWVIGRSASLGCLFFLAAWYSWLKREQIWIFNFIFLISWTLALFSYESVWILPVVLLLTPKNQTSQWKSSIKNKWYLSSIVIFFFYLIIRYVVTKEWLGSYEASSFQHFQFNKLAINFFKLLSRTLVPPITGENTFITLSLISLSILASLFISIFYKKLNTVLWNALLIIWLLSYLPYLSLGISTKTIESERFLYLPSLFFSLLIVYSLFLYFNKSKWLVVKIGMTGLIVFHAFLFIQSGKKYAEAGEMVENTWKQLSEKGIYPILLVENLPATLEGIPTFRTGFDEGYHWIVDPKHQSTIQILSQQAFPDAKIRLHHKSEMGTLLIQFDEH